MPLPLVPESGGAGGVVDVELPVELPKGGVVPPVSLGVVTEPVGVEPLLEPWLAVVLAVGVVDEVAFFVDVLLVGDVTGTLTSV